MGRFVEIEVAGDRVEDALGRSIVGACPVDIFVQTETGLATVAEREDECILCGRCVELAPDAVTARRAYGSRAPVHASGGRNG